MPAPTLTPLDDTATIALADATLTLRERERLTAPLSERDIDALWVVTNTIRALPASPTKNMLQVVDVTIHEYLDLDDAAVVILGRDDHDVIDGMLDTISLILATSTPDPEPEPEPEEPMLWEATCDECGYSMVTFDVMDTALDLHMVGRHMRSMFGQVPLINVRRLPIHEPGLLAPPLEPFPLPDVTIPERPDGVSDVNVHWRPGFREVAVYVYVDPEREVATEVVDEYRAAVSVQAAEVIDAYVGSVVDKRVLAHIADHVTGTNRSPRPVSEEGALGSF